MTGDVNGRLKKIMPYRQEQPKICTGCAWALPLTSAESEEVYDGGGKYAETEFSALSLRRCVGNG